jgi:glycine/D-amino acid oxidase-like deaminating enzyme
VDGRWFRRNGIRGNRGQITDTDRGDVRADRALFAGGWIGIGGDRESGPAGPLDHSFSPLGGHHITTPPYETSELDQ